MAVVAIVGDAGSGKTLLAEQVVARLVADGVRVGYVKHAPHGFEPGRPDSDSERVLAAGADPVAVLGRDGLLQLTVRSGQHEEQLTQLLTGLRGEVVLLEGFSAGSWPKIRVCASGRDPRAVADPVLLDLTRPAVGRFESDAVERAVTLLTGLRAAHGPDRVRLAADGRPVPVRGFAEAAVAGTLRGLLGTLRGVEDPARLEVEVERSDRA